MVDPYPEPLADWYGCYGKRPDLFTRESLLHPAKMAVPLCSKIFDHGQQHGYWAPGDLVVDPMAGTGTTLIVGAAMGYAMLGVELEVHFIQMAVGNIARLAQRAPSVVRHIIGLIKGDARQLHQLLTSAAGILTSPPYPSAFRQDHPGTAGGKTALELSRGGSFRGYGAIITSPPYGDQALPGGVSRRIRNLARAGQWAEAIAAYKEEEVKQVAKGNKWALTSDEAIRVRIQQALALEDGGYGGLGAMITSPPYGDQAVTTQSDFLSHRRPDGAPAADATRDGYAAAVVTSPPYTGDYVSEARSKHLEPARIARKGIKARVGRYKDGTIPEFHYGRSVGQIGDLPDTERNIGKETYAIAMLRVYQAMFASLRPGGVVCLVTKNPIKRGKMRQLDHLTMDLMRRAGFVFLERYRAMLAQNLGAQHRMFDQKPKDRVVEKKSYFKRCFEGRYPHLKVDHEDVMFFRKPQEDPNAGP